MKVYRGYSDREDAVGANVVVVVADEHGTRQLCPAESVSWGYDGHGPRNLAAALLVDAQGLSIDYDTFQSSEETHWIADAFMRAVVAAFPQGGRWELSVDTVLGWLALPLTDCPYCSGVYDSGRYPGSRCPTCEDSERWRHRQCDCGHFRVDHRGGLDAAPAGPCEEQPCSCPGFRLVERCTPRA
jgi:hypothetical protein